MHPKNLSIGDFSYALPEENIASHPLPQRDQSRLLIYKNGAISEDTYSNIASHLPGNSLLVFNDTKVIKARILFQKQTGGVIEIFCLEPMEASHDYARVMQQAGEATWKCMIGGVGKWKEKILEKRIATPADNITLKATLINKLPDAYVVKLSWEPASLTFGEILGVSGVIPLPPYIKRKVVMEDADRYQTVYSKNDGSVAAPTAGLHFTEEVFASLREKNIETAFLTLHVGAGTFKPVKSEKMAGHEMHAEWMQIPLTFLQQLKKNEDRKVYCVGTTSLRALESVYWLGAKLKINPELTVEELWVDQWEVYETSFKDISIPTAESIECLTRFLESRNLDKLLISTQIIIAPGYTFKIAEGLLTNFHQPKSTLLLLVAALAGKEWKNIYNYALQNNFRFLSYGDGCLILAN